jgi:uncharacterized glyoxalase superfamily protein PhnB
VQTITPYLLYQDAAAALAFLSHAFGFEEIKRMTSPDGRVGHAEMRFGDGEIHLGQPEQPSSPRSYGGTSVLLYVYVEDVDEHCARSRRRARRSSTNLPIRSTASGAITAAIPKGTPGTSRKCFVLRSEPISRGHSHTLPVMS